jgi:hypothetical protein
VTGVLGERHAGIFAAEHVLPLPAIIDYTAHLQFPLQ